MNADSALHDMVRHRDRGDACGSSLHTMGLASRSRGTAKVRLRQGYDGHTALKRPSARRSFSEGGWWSRGGSNSRPPHCERGALPAELRPQTATDAAVRGVGCGHLGPPPGPVNKPCRRHAGLFAPQAGRVHVRHPRCDRRQAHARALSRHRSRPAALHLHHRRGGGDVLADRVQCREHAQPVRGDGRGLPLPHHRAGAAADPQPACPISAASTFRR